MHVIREGQKKQSQKRHEGQAWHDGIKYFYVSRTLHKHYYY